MTIDSITEIMISETEAIKNTIGTAIKLMLKNGICDPKEIYAVCNCIAQTFEFPLNIIVDMFELILPTINNANK